MEHLSRGVNQVGMPQLEIDTFIPVESLLPLFEEYLEEASIDTLEKETHRGFPRTGKRLYSIQMVDIKSTSFVPYIGVKTLLVSSMALGEEHEGNRKWYRPMLLFTGVNYTPEKGPNSVTVRYQNKDYFFDKLSLELNDARVRCDCPDFRFRFSWWNAQRKSLYGQPQKYVRKTTTRPPVNPMKVIGICKHIGKLSVVLFNSGVIGR